VIPTIILVLAGCATPYQSIESLNLNGGGYADAQIAEDMFTVSFRGNGYTSRDRVDNMALLRAADITLENGFRYFIILDQDKSVRSDTHTTPVRASSRLTNLRVSPADPIYGPNYVQVTGNIETSVSGGNSITWHRERSSLSIVCYYRKPVAEGVVSYDATFIQKSLKEKYGIAENKKKASSAVKNAKAVAASNDTSSSPTNADDQASSYTPKPCKPNSQCYEYSFQARGYSTILKGISEQACTLSGNKWLTRCD